MQISVRAGSHFAVGEDIAADGDHEQAGAGECGVGCGVDRIERQGEQPDGKRDASDGAAVADPAVGDGVRQVAA